MIMIISGMSHPAILIVMIMDFVREVLPSHSYHNHRQRHHHHLHIYQGGPAQPSRRSNGEGRALKPGQQLRPRNKPHKGDDGDYGDDGDCGDYDGNDDGDAGDDGDDDGDGCQIWAPTWVN